MTNDNKIPLYRISVYDICDICDNYDNCFYKQKERISFRS